MPKAITLSTDYSGDVTVIPNIFFDEYLPRANGEFLKIYLYLLRWLPAKDCSLTLGGIADTFCMTENDVIRSLRYWEKEGLLNLTCDGSGNITAIRINAIQFHTTADGQSPASSPACTSPVPAAGVNPLSSADSRKNYSMQELQRFTDGGNGEQLIFIIQQYLGHPLSPTDLNTVYYFYDGLGFSTDLIEYLFEYCVSNGHTHMRYIEKVALSWADQHITTADEARTRSEAHQRACFAVLKAFGLGGRMPTSGEVEYVNKWTHTYGFSLELVLEACRRTMMAVHTPSFEYTDKILSNWKSLNAFTMTEVLAADKARSAQKTAPSSRPSVRTPRPSSNKFHNFKQRSYDYEALEKKLSQKIQTASGDTQ